MAGSILEAILTDVLTNPSRIATSTASGAAPSGKGSITAGGWDLVDLIKVAVDVKILPAERAESIDRVLRHYRNFIHPKREIRAAHACTEAEAFMAKGGLDGVCNHLEAKLGP
jgi:hypothetical protein